jgi:hypothetical protein
MCGISNWNWSYKAQTAPELRALTDATGEFSDEFEIENPIPRLAMIAMKNANRNRPDVPRVITDLTKAPELVQFFEAKPLVPVELPVILQAYEQRILPVIDPLFLKANDREQPLILTRGKPPSPVDVESCVPFVSQEDGITGPIEFGEIVVVDRQWQGVVTAENPDGTFDVEVLRVNVPDIGRILRQQTDKEYLPFLSAIPKIAGRPFQLVNRIIGMITIDGENYGMQLAMNHQLAPDRWKKEFRLASMLIQVAFDGRTKEFFSFAATEAVRQYIQKVPGILRLVDRPKESITFELLFDGNTAHAREVRNWLGKAVQHERPLVTRSHSPKQIANIEQELARAAPATREILRNVSSDRIVRKMTRVPTHAEVEFASPYISVGCDAFGEIGFIVGYSEITKVAAFVQTKENPRFVTFGGMLNKRVGIITTLDHLVKVERVAPEPPSSPSRSPRRGKFTGWR